MTDEQHTEKMPDLSRPSVTVSRLAKGKTWRVFVPADDIDEAKDAALRVHRELEDALG